MSEPLLEARGLRRSYRRGPEEVHAVEDASLELAPGEVVGLVGPSGSGKSTLLGLLAGWERPDAGEIRWRGRPAAMDRIPWRELAVLPQALGLIEELSVAENVLLPARLARERTDNAERLLIALGLSGLADRMPPELSIGEQQRTALARALVLRPAAVLADEPSGHQDAESAERVFALLREAAAGGAACLVATHSDEALAFCDRVVSIRDGRLELAGMLRP